MPELPTDAVHQGSRENSLVVTALRSAFKELGLLPTNIEVRGPSAGGPPSGPWAPLPGIMRSCLRCANREPGLCRGLPPPHVCLPHNCSSLADGTSWWLCVHKVLGTMRRAQDATGQTELTPVLAYVGELEDISDLTPGRSHAEVSE